MFKFSKLDVLITIRKKNLTVLKFLMIVKLYFKLKFLYPNPIHMRDNI